MNKEKFKNQGGFAGLALMAILVTTGVVMTDWVQTDHPEVQLEADYSDLNE